MTALATETIRPCVGALVAVLLLSGCEDVINVELKDTEPRLVIEGALTNQFSRSKFLISRTTDFYDPTIVETVSGATIIVTDDFGYRDSLVERLPESSPGEYSYHRFPPQLVPGRTYTATVSVHGNTYTASTTIPAPITIDSLRTEYQEGGGIGTEADEGYRLHVIFRDAPQRSDYVRITLSTLTSRYLDFYLYDGRYSDGNVIDYNYFLNVFQPGDTVIVDLTSMDKTMYYYFLTLSEVWASEEGGNFLDATPANPNTNWSGGALGYFGAFAVDSKAIPVPHNPLQRSSNDQAEPSVDNSDCSHTISRHLPILPALHGKMREDK